MNVVVFSKSRNWMGIRKHLSGHEMKIQAEHVLVMLFKEYRACSNTPK